MFQISATLFWGWQSYVNINDCDTIERVVDKVKTDLKKYLQNANLEELVKKVDEMHLHTHEDIETIFYDRSRADQIFYLCDHC
jgi:hypothetical protein